MDKVVMCLDFHGVMDNSCYDNVLMNKSLSGDDCTAQFLIILFVPSVPLACIGLKEISDRNTIIIVHDDYYNLDE